jgi:hypothetical protein
MSLEQEHLLPYWTQAFATLLPKTSNFIMPSCKRKKDNVLGLINSCDTPGQLAVRALFSLMRARLSNLMKRFRSS